MSPEELQHIIKEIYFVEQQYYIKPSFWQDMFKAPVQKKYTDFWTDLLIAGIKQHKNYIVDYVLRHQLAHSNAVFQFEDIPNHQCIDYMMPMHVAVYFHNSEAAWLLQKYGANTHRRNGQFLTPRGLARKMDKQNEMLMRQLVEKHFAALKKQKGSLSAAEKKTYKHLLRFPQREDMLKAGIFLPHKLRLLNSYEAHLNTILKMPRLSGFSKTPLTQPRVFLRNEELYEKWENFNRNIPKNQYINPLKFLSAIASLRRYERETPQEEALTLINKTLLLCAENGFNNLFQYIVQTGMGSMDFLNSEEATALRKEVKLLPQAEALSFKTAQTPDKETSDTRVAQTPQATKYIYAYCQNQQRSQYS